MGVLNWLAGRVIGPLMGASAFVLALVCAVQTARIEGWPLIGGGFKAQVADLQAEITARDLAQAKAQSAALIARAQARSAAEQFARIAATNDQAIQRQIQTVIREVPRAVPNSSACAFLPWGAVRLLDAAASGADLRDVAAAIAPGQPDDAPSTVTLPEAVTLFSANFGIARQNAEQLRGLQAAVAP